MSETTDNYSNGRHARLSGAEARAAADAARAAREGSHFTSAPAQPEQGFSYGDAARGAAAAGTADIAGNAWAVGTGGVPGDSGTVADAGFADAAAPRRPRSSRLDDRGTQRANRRRDARVAPDRAADGRPAEPRREAASLPTIDVNGALSAIGNFVVHFRVALLIAALVLGVLMAMYGPVQTYYRAWRAGQDLQTQLDELNASNEQYKTTFRPSRPARGSRTRRAVAATSRTARPRSSWTGSTTGRTTRLRALTATNRPKSPGTSSSGTRSSITSATDAQLRRVSGVGSSRAAGARPNCEPARRDTT